MHESLSSNDELAHTINLFSTTFLNPLYGIDLFLWEIGREDFIRPSPIFSPVIHGDLNFKNILISIGKQSALGKQLRVWLIDFADARPGHIFFDLAKIEIEFRALILAKVFKELVDKNEWDKIVAFKVSLLIEHVLLQDKKVINGEKDLNTTLQEYTIFNSKNVDSQWYDKAHKKYSLYWEDLLLFLSEVRRTAYKLGTQLGTEEQFYAHYPVSLFFIGISSLKFTKLEEDVSIYPWSKLLPLTQSLVASTIAIKEVKGRNAHIRKLRQQFRRSVAVAIVRGHQGAYLLHYEKSKNERSWEGFFLLGGQKHSSHINSPIALEDQILAEQGIKRTKYDLHREPRVIRLTQFSQRSCVFQDYEFYVYILKPKDKSIDWAHKYTKPEHELKWANINEISQMHFNDEAKTCISATVKKIFDEMGLLED